MNENFINKVTSKFNFSLFSKIALILTAISCIRWIMTYSVVDFDAEVWSYELEFFFPGIDGLISLAIFLAPYILLTLFFSKCRDKISMPILASIVFGLMSINSLVAAINNFSYGIRIMVGIVDLLFLIIWAFLSFACIYFKKYHKKFDPTVIIPLIFGTISVIYINSIFQRLGYFYYTVDVDFWLISNIVLTVLFILSTISALRGLSKKIFIVIGLSIGIILEVIELIRFSVNIGYLIETERYLNIIINPISIIGECLLYICLLMFCLKNKIPVILSQIQKRKKEISPEQELRALKDKLELGMIAEEEYQTQRAEIISRL